MNDKKYINYLHYFSSDVSPEFQAIFLEMLKNKNEPLWVGQGCSKSCGSDTYGYYVVSKTKIKNKTVWGIIAAHSEFGPHGWASGTEYCSLPNNKKFPEECKPTNYIVQSGHHKNGSPKFYFCDKNGKKFNGQKCYYNFHGAYSYRDPSF